MFVTSTSKEPNKMTWRAFLAIVLFKGAEHVKVYVCKTQEGLAFEVVVDWPISLVDFQSMDQ